MANNNGSTAEDLADKYAEGDSEYDKHVMCGGSGKQRTKQELVEHKRPDPEGDTRKIVQNAQNAEEKRKEEERQKLEKKDSANKKK